MILIHGYTGAIDLVSKAIGNACKENCFDAIPDNALKKLNDRGYLTSKFPSEEQEWLKKLGKSIHKREIKMHNFMFAIAYDCNFRCAYCYESAISNNGNNWKGEVFTKEMVDAAYEAIDTINVIKEPRHRITLYGGEPLLKKNKHIVDYIIANGINRGFNFGAITNGYEINFYEDLLAQDKIGFLQITLDGNASFHNQRRYHFQDGNTFDRILKNISIALDHDVNVSVRINVDKDNISDISKLGDKFVELNWHNHNRFFCYVHPIHSHRLIEEAETFVCGGEPCVDSGLKMNSYEVLKFLLKKLSSENGKLFKLPDDQTKKTIRKILREGGHIPIRTAFCGAHNGGVIFDPVGNIYSCWEFIGHEFATTGKFYPKFEYDTERIKKWNNRTFYNIETCSSCKYALFCGGGCSARGITTEQDFNQSYCDSYPAIFHQSVKDAYHEFLLEDGQKQ